MNCLKAEMLKKIDLLMRLKIPPVNVLKSSTSGTLKDCLLYV